MGRSGVQLWRGKERNDGPYHGEDRWKEQIQSPNGVYDMCDVWMYELLWAHAESACKEGAV